MDYSNCTYISWEKYEESPEIQIRQGDILLVKTGSSFGKCAYVDTLPQKATINPQFVTLKNIRINALYLTLVLQSSYSRKCYDEFVLGTAIPTFTQEKLSCMMVPLPSYTEQELIVNKVNKWCLLIDKIDKEKIILEELIKQTKSKILSLAIQGKLVEQDPTDESASETLKRINPTWQPCDTSHYPFFVPSGWQTVIIGDVFNHNTGKALNSSNQEGDILPYITTSNLYWGRFELNHLRTMKFKPSELERCQAIYGDLLICEGGDIGRAAIWEKAAPICIQNHIHKLRQKKHNTILPKFYYYVFMLYKSLNMIGGKGIAVQGLSTNDLHKLEIPLPPLNEQKRIVEKIEGLFKALDAIQAELTSQ